MEKSVQSFRKKTVINTAMECLLHNDRIILNINMFQNYTTEITVCDFPNLHCTSSWCWIMCIMLCVCGVSKQAVKPRAKQAQTHKLIQMENYLKHFWKQKRKWSKLSRVSHTSSERGERFERVRGWGGLCVCKMIFGPSVCFTTTPETPPSLVLSRSLSPFLPIPSHSPLQKNAMCHWKKPVAFVMENCTDGVTSTLGEGQLLNLKTVTPQDRC